MASLKPKTVNRNLIVPGPEISNNSENLEAFAKRVEERIKHKLGAFATERLVARLMTSRDERIAALMTSKWIEWRYGKPKENAESVRAFAIQIINHIPRPGELAQSDGDLGPEIANEPSKNSEMIIIQSEPKSKQ